MSRTSLPFQVLVTVWSLTENILFSGLRAGWPALVYVLKEEGVYQHLCVNSTALSLPPPEALPGLNDPGNGPQTAHNWTDGPQTANNWTDGPQNANNWTDGPQTAHNWTYGPLVNASGPLLDCSKQDVVFNQCFTSASALMSVSSLLYGHLNFRFGIRVPRVLSVFIFFSGSLCLAFVSVDQPWLVFPGLILVSAGGNALYITNSQVSYYFTTAAVAVVGLECGALEASAFVLSLIKLAYQNGLSLRSAFITLGVMNLGILISTFWLFPKEFVRPKNQEGQTENVRPKDQETKTENVRPKDQETKTENVRPKDQEGQTENDRPKDQEGQTENVRPKDQEGQTENVRPKDQEGQTENVRPKDQEGQTGNVRPKDQEGQTENVRPKDQEGQTENDRPKDQEGQTENVRPKDQEGQTENVRPKDQEGQTENVRPKDEEGQTDNAAETVERLGDCIPSKKDALDNGHSNLKPGKSGLDIVCCDKHLNNDDCKSPVEGSETNVLEFESYSIDKQQCNTTDKPRVLPCEQVKEENAYLYDGILPAAISENLEPNAKDVMLYTNVISGTEKESPSTMERKDSNSNHAFHVSCVDPTAVPESKVIKNDHGSIWQNVFSKTFLLYLFWASVVQLVLSMALGTFNPWLEYVLDGNTHQVSEYTDILFYSMLASPVISLSIGMAIDTLQLYHKDHRPASARTMFSAAVSLGVTSVTCVLVCVQFMVSKKDSLVLTSIALVLFRNCLYSCGTGFLRIMYGTEKFGLLCGVMAVTAGGVAFLQFPLFVLVQAGPHAWAEVFGGLAFLGVISLLQPVYLYWRSYSV